MLIIKEFDFSGCSKQLLLKNKRVSRENEKNISKIFCFD
ncbi:hypothetical protein HPHPP30_1125 [Helicobacter pylori Hp P-30]|nr:hypothetical protein HPHPP30_1125 [Helicobacter pylori Hp P-30]